MFKYNTSLEKQKIFISGLPFSCSREELEKMCGSHGTVTDVRLVTYRSGKPKVSGGGGLAPPPIAVLDHFFDSAPPAPLQGLAYVEFSREAEASQAVLKMDGMELEGNKISVAISNPPRRTATDKSEAGRTSADLLPRQLYGA